MAKIRDTATVILEDGMPKLQRGGSSNPRRSGRVNSWQVDRRVWKFAMDLVDNDGSRILPINEHLVQILPEK